MPDPIGLRISGTGHCLPARAVPNTFFESILDTSDAWIAERTGIRNRYFVNEQESTATLCEAAARRALDQAGLTPTDLDMILVATVTPEHIMPSTGCVLQTNLGCRQIPAIDMSAACSGFVYAMCFGAAMINTGRYKHILVLGAETLSRIVDMEDRTSCILFGDGAGAAVISAMPDASGPAMLFHELHADGSGGKLLTLPAGGSKLPTSQMTLNERLHFMKMKGRELFKVAVLTMYEAIFKAAEAAGLTMDDIRVIVPHQSNLRIMEATRDRLGIPPEKLYINIDRMGNTSAASIPIALDELRRAGRIRSGDHVMLMAFGAGLTWGTIVLRV